MYSRLASGWPDDSKETKTDAKEVALSAKVSDLKNQGYENQAAFANGQRKNRWKSDSGMPQRLQCLSI
jgi:hypothetical protein